MQFIRPSALPYYAHSLVTLSRYFSLGEIAATLAGRRPIITVDGRLRFRVADFMDVWALKEVLIDRVYERAAPLPAHGLVIDIGGGVGDFSVAAARNGCEVVAYEADPHRQELFIENMGLNGAARVVLQRQRAASLPEIFTALGVDRCDFLKIDCEGGEYELFSGAGHELLGKIRALALEAHLFTPAMAQAYARLISSLQQAGFKLCIRANEVHRSLKYVYAYSSEHRLAN